MKQALLAITFILALILPIGLAGPSPVSAAETGCSFSVSTPSASGDGWWYARTSTNCSTTKYREAQVCIYSSGIQKACTSKWGTFEDISVSTACRAGTTPFGYIQAWGWVYWSNGTTSQAWGNAVYTRNRCA